MNSNMPDCNVTIIGAGPYGLSSSAYLQAAGVETRVFGAPMSFWEDQMPAGMCLRSNWGASHIADPKQERTLDAFCRQSGSQITKPIPLECFIAYGRWYHNQSARKAENRIVRSVTPEPRGFKVALADGEEFTSRRVVVAAGIGAFAARPVEFEGIPTQLASHSTESKDLSKFKGKRVAVIGAGQSGLESAALLTEAGAEVEVIARTKKLNWVGLHPGMHRLGALSRMMYSKHDVGPAGISRLVAMPHLFRTLPRGLQDRIAYRAIRPAGSGWLRPRLKGVTITLGRSVASVTSTGSQLRLRLDDGTERLVDHALLATGFRPDVSRYPFLPPALLQRLKTAAGFPVLRRGLESSIPGLHFLGKNAAWSFGPLLGFVSGTEFAANALVSHIARRNGTH